MEGLWVLPGRKVHRLSERVLIRNVLDVWISRGYLVASTVQECNKLLITRDVMSDE